MVVYHRPAFFAFYLLHEVHQCHVLDILTEGRHQGRVTQLGPYVLHFVKQHHKQVVQAQLGLVLALQDHVDAGVHALQVGHHGAHHAARQAALQQEGRHVLVGRIHEVAQEVVDELLCHGACLHVGFHVDLRHLETGILQHGLHGDDIGMHLAPRHRLHGHVDDIGTILAHFEDGGHREARAAMPVILDEHIGMLLLDALHQASQHGRTSDAGHVLQADFGSTGGYQLVGDVGIIVHRMHGRIGDAEGGLGNHPRLKGIFDGRNDVARLVQSAEDAGDVHTLGMLHLVHQAAHVGGHGIHAEGVQSAVEHVRLNAHFMERLGEGTHGLVGILAIEQVDLLEGATIGLHTGKASHLDDEGGNAHQLVYPRLILAGRLPHVTIDEAEFNFLFHVDFGFYDVSMRVHLNKCKYKTLF